MCPVTVVPCWNILDPHHWSAEDLEYSLDMGGVWTSCNKLVSNTISQNNLDDRVKPGNEDQLYLGN